MPSGDDDVRSDDVQVKVGMAWTGAVTPTRDGPT
jgi:hypothetical protein